MAYTWRMFLALCMPETYVYNTILQSYRNTNLKNRTDFRLLVLLNTNVKDQDDTTKIFVKAFPYMVK